MLDGSQFDLIEHVEQEVCRHRLGAADERVETLAGEDRKRLLAGQIARVDLLIHEERGDSGAGLAVREHPEARQDTAVLGKDCAVQVDAAVRRKLDQGLGEDLRAADGDEELGAERTKALEEGRRIDVEHALARHASVTHDPRDRPAAEPRRGNAGGERTSRPHTERAEVATSRARRSLALVQRRNNEDRGHVRSLGEHAFVEDRQVERVVDGEEDDVQRSPHATRTSERRPNANVVSNEPTRPANRPRPTPCAMRTRRGISP